MARANRSTGVTAIGIINLIVGIPCLCCGGFMSGSGFINAVTKPDPTQVIKIDDRAAANNPFAQGMRVGLEQQAFLQKELPRINLVRGLTYGAGTVGSLLLLVSGILLLLRVGLGKWVCVAGATLVLISMLAEVGYTSVFVYPATQKFAETQKREGKAPPAGAGTGSVLGQFLQPCGALLLGGGYSLLAIAVMLGSPASAFGIPTRRRREDEHGDNQYGLDDDRRDDFDDRPDDRHR